MWNNLHLRAASFFLYFWAFLWSFIWASASPGVRRTLLFLGSGFVAQVEAFIYLQLGEFRFESGVLSEWSYRVRAGWRGRVRDLEREFYSLDKGVRRGTNSRFRLNVDDSTSGFDRLKLTVFELLGLGHDRPAPGPLQNKNKSVFKDKL